MKTIRLSFPIFFVLIISSFSARQARGDTAAAPTPTSLPIAQELAAVVPAWTKPNHLVLYVEPSPKSPGPNLTSAPPALKGETPIDVATGNGYKAEWFGNTLAVVPPTTTVLGTDPQLLDLPIGQLAAVTPLPALLNSLTENQLNQLASTGISQADLSPDQLSLFDQLVPDPVEEVPTTAVEPNISFDDNMTKAQIQAIWEQYDQDTANYDAQIVKVPASQVLGQARLHAYLQQSFAVTVFDSSGNDHSYYYNNDKNFSSGSMKLIGDETMANDRGSVSNDNPIPAIKSLDDLLCDQQPNTAKPTNFDWAAINALAPFALTPVNTVDDLVNVIAKNTHLELYADVSYGDRKLYIGGDLAATYKVADLMRALALCVCGTWRQVGSAYVLTDDVVGLGARQQFLIDVANHWSNRIQTIKTARDKRLNQLNWPAALSPFPGCSTFVPPDQLKTVTYDDGSNCGVTTWSSLPQELQDDLIHPPDQQGGDGADNQPTSAAKPIDPDAPVKVYSTVDIAIELPTEGIMSLYSFSPSPDVSSTKRKSTSTKIEMTEKVRAVICAPKTALEARQTVDFLPGMGLNTIIVDVFNNGKAYFPNSAVTPASDEAANVLSATVAEARIKHINVLAAIDLYCWSKGANLATASWPASVSPDLNIFGEPSDIGGARRKAQNVIDEVNRQSDLFEWHNNQEAEVQTYRWVSPFDPVVDNTLHKLIAALAVFPGISGVVLQDTAPPGYTGRSDGFLINLDLGYTPSIRLAYLRTHHVDPVDVKNFGLVFLNGGLGSIYDIVSVRGFHDRSGDQKEWAAYRSKGDQAALRDFYVAAKTVNPSLPLYIRDSIVGLTIAPWTSPLSSGQVDLDSGNPYSSINRETILAVPFAAASATTTSLPDALKDFTTNNSQSPINAIAFDLENGGIDNSVPLMLGDLASYLAPVSN